MDIQIDVENPIIRGPLTLFALFSSEPEAEAYVTGPEAAEHRLFDVREVGDGARVPELEIDNRAEHPLLLVDGEILIGVKQNRTLNVSVICPPKARTVIPVSCVEAGRWGAARKARHSRHHAGISLRDLKNRSVRESMSQGAGKRSDQRAIWDSVERYSAKFSAASPTSSYEEVLDQAEESFESLVTGLEPVEGQRGVLVGIAGRVRALDLFDRHSTLRAYWKSLLAGYASDAFGEKSEVTSLEGARAFLKRVATAKFERVPGVGLGDEAHSGSEELTASALRWGKATVHLAAFLE